MIGELWQREIVYQFIRRRFIFLLILFHEIRKNCRNRWRMSFYLIFFTRNWFAREVLEESNRCMCVIFAIETFKEIFKESNHTKKTENLANFSRTQILNLEVNIQNFFYFAGQKKSSFSSSFSKLFIIFFGRILDFTRVVF